MTATTRGSPVGGNESQGQAPDAQSQPPLPQNQVRTPLFLRIPELFICYTISRIYQRAATQLF